MSRETGSLNADMQSWLHEHSLRETDVQRALRHDMGTHPEGGMQTSPEQAQFMALLFESIGGKRAIEVGVFTGYSALAIAHVLPPGGELVACDISEEFMSVARSWWERDGMSDRITSRVGPAAQTLQALIDEGQAGTFDFMYVDADKESSPVYYELGLQLLRPGGFIGIDNMFLGGKVVDPAEDGSNVVATREIARILHDDQRVSYSLVPVGDGLGLAMKRP